MFINPNEPIECKDKTMFGLVIKGCGWKGLYSDLIEEYEDDTSPSHPLSGHKAYIYKCPNCKNTLDEVILSQS